MIPAALLDAIADEATAISGLARQLGARVHVEPIDLLQRDIELQPPNRWSPNRHCQLVKTADGWIAVNLARADDRAAVSAWLECEIDQEPWDAVANFAPLRSNATLLERAYLLGLPVTAVGETTLPQNPNFAKKSTRQRNPSDMSVIDLSALWAGPSCGGLLAEAGMAVTKIEDPSRPDPTRAATPEHDRRLNGLKRRVCMPLSDPQLLALIAKADVLITSARPHALARLGLTAEALFARNPALIWVAITAHGFKGAEAMRVGFGDDCAAAGGLVNWTGGSPHFLGDALADPLTGLRAAHLALLHVAEGQSGLIDIALAATAAEFAQSAGLR